MKEPGTPTARKLPAAGFVRHGNRQIAVRFDEDTFQQIKDLAVRDGVSFAEKVRLLVEWGLET